MANHGAVAFGRSLLQAYQRIEAVEHFAKVMLVVHQLGKKSPLKDEDIQKLLAAKKDILALLHDSRNAADSMR